MPIDFSLLDDDAIKAALDQQIKAASQPASGAIPPGAKPSSFPPRVLPAATSPEGELARKAIAASRSAPAGAVPPPVVPEVGATVPKVGTKLPTTAKIGGALALAQELPSIGAVALDPKASGFDVATQVADSGAKLAGGFLGAKAGAAVGALGGPVAPLTVPAGAIVGGALGYLGTGKATQFLRGLVGTTPEAPGDASTLGDFADRILPGAAPAPKPTPLPPSTTVQAPAPSGIGAIAQLLSEARQRAPARGPTKFINPLPAQDVEGSPMGAFMNLAFGAADTNLAGADDRAADKRIGAQATQAREDLKILADLQTALNKADKPEVKVIQDLTGKPQVVITDPKSGESVLKEPQLQAKLYTDGKGGYFMMGPDGQPRPATENEIAQARTKGAIK